MSVYTPRHGWRVTTNWRWHPQGNMGGKYTYFHGDFAGGWPSLPDRQTLVNFLGGLYKACSDVEPYQIKMHRTYYRDPPPDKEDYAGAQTVNAAIFVFRTVTPPGFFLSIPVPAPKDEIFRTTNPNLLDLTHPAVSSFANWVVLNCVDRFGNDLDEFVGGYRGILKWEHNYTT